MDDYFIGIDVGTQSTKGILLSTKLHKPIATATFAHEMVPNLPPSHKEQHPQDWIAATDHVIQNILNSVEIDRSQIRGIGVSGQQHGFVALDEEDQVIRPAKLWCDVSTAEQAEEIIARLGGLEKTIALTGNGLPAGFTASKILWLKEKEPDHFARLATV